MTAPVPPRDIKLTAARAAVLRGVAAGEVKHHRNWGSEPDEDTWRPGGYGHRKVNAVVEFLRKAGLIEMAPAEHPSMYAPKPWQLTDAGKQWLAEH